MADYNEWGHSKTDKATLDEYWDKLLERADKNDKEEIHYFLHCTSQKGRKGIEKSGYIKGGGSDLPAHAPLASYPGLKGTWFALSGKELPTRSPYGTQRMRFKVKDILAYLGTDGQTEDRDSDDVWDAPEEENTAKSGTGGKGQKGKAKGQKKKKVNPKQKECYLKNKVPQKKAFAMPLLFFECAHFYGNNQYVRLLLVRASDPQVEWCREMCKEIEIYHNPFFQVMHGRLYTYRHSPERSWDVFIEVLLVGDLALDQIQEGPEWDQVGTLTRAGFNPRLGVCS